MIPQKKKKEAFDEKHLDKLCDIVLGIQNIYFYYAIFSNVILWLFFVQQTSIFVILFSDDLDLNYIDAHILYIDFFYSHDIPIDLYLFLRKCLLAYI